MKKLKVYLVRQGIKQRELARALGWSDSKVSFIVNGDRKANRQDIEDIAEVLGLKPERIAEMVGQEYVP